LLKADRRGFRWLNTRSAAAGPHEC
jgi:hypothetical protein